MNSMRLRSIQFEPHANGEEGGPPVVAADPNQYLAAYVRSSRAEATGHYQTMAYTERRATPLQLIEKDSHLHITGKHKTLTEIQKLF